MPRCNLSQSFLEELLKHKTNKVVQYYDIDLIGFFLEYRISGIGTWYFRYKNKQNKKCFYRIGTTKKIDAILARKHVYNLKDIISQGDNPKYINTNIDTNTDSKSRMRKRSTEDIVKKQYLPHIKLKKRSWELDKHVFEKYFLPVFGKRFISSINCYELNFWIDNLVQTGLSFNSCNRFFAVIRSFFSCVVRWGILQATQNPCLTIKRFSEIIPEVQYLDKDQMQNVFQELEKVKSISAKALQLLLLTGARKSEIMKARWEYINLQSRILTVPLSKSGKARYIPLSDKAVKIIENLAQNKENPWLFPALNGKSHITSLYHTWNNLRKKLDLQNVRIHDLRHSFASLLVTSGSSLYEVQKILGHHDPKVTMRYAHFGNASLVKIANLVGDNI